MNAHVPHPRQSAPRRTGPLGLFPRISLRARIVVIALGGGILQTLMWAGFVLANSLSGSDLSEETFITLVIMLGLGALLTLASAATVFLSLGLTRVISGIAVACDVVFLVILLGGDVPRSTSADLFEYLWSLIVLLVLFGIFMIGPPLIIATASPERETVAAPAMPVDPDASPEPVPGARTLPDALAFAAIIGAVLAFIGLPLAGNWDNWAIFLLALGMLYAPAYAHWISGGLTVVASLRLIVALVTSPGATGAALVVLGLSLAMYWLTLRGQGALGLHSSSSPDSYLA